MLDTYYPSSCVSQLCIYIPEIRICWSFSPSIFVLSFPCSGFLFPPPPSLFPLAAPLSLLFPCCSLSLLSPRCFPSMLLLDALLHFSLSPSGLPLHYQVIHSTTFAIFRWFQWTRRQKMIKLRRTRNKMMDPTGKERIHL